MNRNFALALVIAAAGAGNAFAESPTIDTTPFKSTATRAQVIADLASRGSVSPLTDEYNQPMTFRSTMTRAQVVSELMSARQEVAAYNGEDSGSSFMAHGGRGDSGPTRMAIRTQSAR